MAAVLMILRSRMCRLSIAVVVWMTRRTAGGKAKKFGETRSLCQVFAAKYLPSERTRADAGKLNDPESCTAGTRWYEPRHAGCAACCILADRTTSSHGRNGSDRAPPVTAFESRGVGPSLANRDR